VRFGAKNLSGGRKLFKMRMETQTFLKKINFSFQSYEKILNFYILIDFYLVLLKGVCPRYSCPHVWSVKWPLIVISKE
jgi:hypothetical protein